MLMLVDHNRTVKILFNTEAIGIRKTGRPKLRWEDDVIEEDFESEELESLAMEKESWQKLLRKAQGPPRAVEPLIMMKLQKYVVHQLNSVTSVYLNLFGWRGA
jgi:hypothetical protein